MEKDMNDFLKAHHIAKSIEESLQEKKLKDIQIQDEEFIANITSVENFENCSNELTKAYEKRDLKGFTAKLKVRERNYHRRNVIRRIAISASVAAVFILISFQFINSGDGEVPEIANLEVTEQEVAVPTLITPHHVVKLKTRTHSETVAELVKETDSVFYSRLIVPKGHTYTVMLSDSTCVTLNAGSELTYPSKFVGEQRKVALKGEGYFNVRKNAKSFVVTVENIFVKVYGTQFNINSYDKAKIQTVLVSGSVGVTSANQDAELKLKPHQMATADDNGEIKLLNVNVEKYVAWLRGEIVNDNEPLADFLDNIARWYNVEFIYDNSVEVINISAEIKNDRPLEEVLKSIEIISDVKITKLKDNKYMVRK